MITDFCALLAQICLLVGLFVSVGSAGLYDRIYLGVKSSDRLNRGRLEKLKSL